jgi:hypothetical protein
MNSVDGWRNLFENWPAAIPRSGLIVTTFGETMPFRDFLISGSILLIDRDVPDSLGTRKVMLAYESIAAVKFTSTLDLARFQVMGFQGSL